jgi:hypothetical protein
VIHGSTATGDGEPRLPPGNPEGVLQYRVEAASRCLQDAFPDSHVRAESDGTHWTFALRDSSRMHHVVRFTPKIFQVCSIAQVIWMCDAAIDAVRNQSGSVRVDITLGDRLTVTNL